MIARHRAHCDARMIPPINGTMHVKGAAACRAGPLHGSPLRDDRRMLEVTGGSAATTASAADADFPTLYKVRIRLRHHFLMAVANGSPAGGWLKPGAVTQEEPVPSRLGLAISAPGSLVSCLAGLCTSSHSQPSVPALQESRLARENAETAARLAKELPLRHEALTQEGRYATSMGLQVCSLSLRAAVCDHLPVLLGRHVIP